MPEWTMAMDAIWGSSADTPPNFPLLRKVFEHIAAHPEEWEQADWFSITIAPTQCETAFCFAGHAVNMTEGVTRSIGFGARPASGRGWGEAACDHLGLTTRQGNCLFSSGNSLSDIEEFLQVLFNRYGESW